MSGWMLILGLLLIGVLFIGISLLSVGSFGGGKPHQAGYERADSLQQANDLQNEEDGRPYVRVPASKPRDG